MLVSVVISIVFFYICSISLLWLAVVVFPFIIVFAWGSAYIRSNFYLFVYSQNKKNSNSLVLTFDDGPHPDVTPALLDVLKKHQVKATFFCIGKNIIGNETIVKRIDSEGHIVGNHTFAHHAFLPFFSESGLGKDVASVTNQIKQIIGKSPVFFRPPFGVTSPVYNKVLVKQNLKAIGWSIRSLDTVNTNSSKLMERVFKKQYFGDVLLFHDTQKEIVPFIDSLLAQFAANGIKIVNIDQLFNLEAYEV
jgi:peptidoglycan/xylan/chitin deacetylase (PgdA/CDA1 family)